MNRYLLGCACAGVLACSAAVQAQDAPPPNPTTTPSTPTTTPSTPTTQTPSMRDQARTVTVEGCLVREADVPGREPNVAERAGVMEDYILTTTKMVKGSAPATGTAQATPGGSPTGTSGIEGAMYEVEGIDDEELKRHVGHRVQIEGTFENVDRARPATERQRPADDLVEISGTTIRQVAGDCPAR